MQQDCQIPVNVRCALPGRIAKRMDWHHQKVIVNRVITVLKVSSTKSLMALSIQPQP
jgi:hypothetical protein